jgi:hypothetical protein
MAHSAHYQTKYDNINALLGKEAIRKQDLLLCEIISNIRQGITLLAGSRLCRVVFLTTVVLRCRRVHSVGIMTLTEEHCSARRRTCPSVTLSSTNLRLAWNRTSDTEVSLDEVLINDRQKFQFVPHSKQPVFSQSM